MIICYPYFGARYYASDLSIWLSVDPLSDMYPGTSPYMYVLGNPVMLIDPNGMYASGGGPDGMDPSHNESSTGESETYYGNGKVLTYPTGNTGTSGNSNSTNNQNSHKTEHGNVDILKGNYNTESGYNGDPNSVDLAGHWASLKFTSNEKSNLNQSSSSYRWVQTMAMNCEMNSNYESPWPIGTEVEVVDIEDRHRKSTHITYSGNTMTFTDIFHRIRDDRYINGMYMNATVTLVKLLNDGTVVPVISFTYSIYLNPDGTGGGTNVKKAESVSPFHEKALRGNLPQDTYRQP